ncbi:hypothetical protein KKH39_02390 [Patescibacteria group bacterium]|nr:hypothetical protein [Patescibacteria group bacterium]
MQKKIIRLAIITVVILLIPLIASQFTKDVKWDWFDFILMGILIFGTGLAYELISKRSDKYEYKAAIGIGLLGGFLLFWVNGAVGIIGSEDESINLLYFFVLLIGLIGSFVVRLKARGMIYILLSMAVLQMLVPVIALIGKQLDFDPSVLGVFALNVFFATIFVLSALLFRRADSKK